MLQSLTNGLEEVFLGGLTCSHIHGKTTTIQFYNSLQHNYHRTKRITKTRFSHQCDTSSVVYHWSPPPLNTSSPSSPTSLLQLPTWHTSASSFHNPPQSSQGTVSSTMKTQWQELDQRTRSGCMLVTTISGIKISV